MLIFRVVFSFKYNKIKKKKVFTNILLCLHLVLNHGL